MTATVIGAITGAVSQVTAFFQKILGGLVPTASLVDLAIDAIPRRVEELLYSGGVNASAVLEQVIARLTPAEPIDPGAVDPLVALLVNIKGQIDGVLPNVAGSDMLRVLIKVVPLISTFIAAVVINPSASQPATKVILAHFEIEAEQAASAQRQAAIVSRYTAPDGGTDTSGLMPVGAVPAGF